MTKFLLILLVMLTVQKTISQEFQIVRHEVRLGETVRMLSRKYHVPPAEIYRLNKFAVEGIREGMILQIPAERKYAEAAKAESGFIPEPPQTATAERSGRKRVRHKVEPGETLSGISEKYNVPMKKRKSATPYLSNGWQAGQVITIADE